MVSEKVLADLIYKALIKGAIMFDYVLIHGDK